ncbi:hypothetical protein GWK47_035360 [Chionoecetes opilio]|uniref:Mutator-like transposase domain-containing protein n=1 Tax=Chionoecetes opilio TaxID=41210 RepID=A0A8J4YI76_CHIOP|nr:hypothetical protein GWK47_035360 [Chionoecetes opilio]
MEVGLGFTSYNKLISNMSMTPLYAKYQDTQRHILQKTEQKAKEVMEKTRDAVKRHYTPDQDGIYNIKVIYDGSWQKRGHTSKLAVGAVVEAHTGCVIDFETVSKFCEKCTKKENTKISKKDMEEWKKGHKQKCQKNYDGSSGGMETAAALKLFGEA